MIIVRVEAAPVVPYWRVKAVAVQWPNGEHHMVWGTALNDLGIEHPEVLAQLAQ